MPYCEYCSATRDVTDITETRNPHMRQGTCTHCRQRIFFSADLPVETAMPVEPRNTAPATPAPTAPTPIIPAPVIPDPATAAPVTPAPVEMEPPLTLEVWLNEELPRDLKAWALAHKWSLAAAAGILVLLFVVLPLLQWMSAPSQPLSALVQLNPDPASITITNNNSFAWSDAKFTLNDDYSTQSSRQSVPSHGTIQINFNQFTDWSGHPFDPTLTAAHRMKIMARDDKGHKGKVEVEVK